MIREKYKCRRAKALRRKVGRFDCIDLPTNGLDRNVEVLVVFSGSCFLVLLPVPTLTQTGSRPRLAPSLSRMGFDVICKQRV